MTLLHPTDKIQFYKNKQNSSTNLKL